MAIVLLWSVTLRLNEAISIVKNLLLWISISRTIILLVIVMELIII